MAKREIGRVIRLERFPEDVFRRLKVYAATHDLSMKEIIIAAVDKHLKELEKKKR